MKEKGEYERFTTSLRSYAAIK